MKSRNQPARLSWGWATLAMVGVVVVIVLAQNSVVPDVDLLGSYLFALLSAVVALLGSVIVARQPGHPIARLLLASWAAFLTGAVTAFVAETGIRPAEVTPWILVGTVGYNVVTSVAPFAILLILFVFPTGTYPSRRWRWSGWLAGAVSAALAVVVLFLENVGKVYNPDGMEWSAPNPIGFIPMEVGEAMVSLAVAVTVALGCGGLIAMVVRYRRSDVVVKTQIRWVVYAGLLAFLSVFSTVLSGGNEIVYTLQVFTALVVIPVAMTVAITRYRLFDVDRLISRTLSYSVVIGFLAACYLGLVGLATSLVPAQDDVAVAASTLAVAALFQPVRRRVQRAVDRRFNRLRFHAEAVSDRFAAHMGNAYTLREVDELVTTTISETLEPISLAMWIAPEDASA